MLGISVAVRKQEHVFIDFLTNLMPEKIRKFTNTFVQLLRAGKKNPQPLMQPKTH
ncbi:N-acetylneuraminate transporter small subunit [Haemophilus influenzae HK1212]|uniref:TRAP transporter small permease protein n=1 Tax=Haemophilus influenzae HK1212 TaxID=456482 RepID=A0A7G2JXF2_HAEIF|nr:N-acetylneuraminate transporter small subunit [Haemophilus influenzae HK1212]